MRSQSGRLIFAAVLSCAGAYGTYYWYKSTEKKVTKNIDRPLAQVDRVHELVMRRPSTRLLWNPVTTGDRLYSGEAIRTSSQSEVRIQFDDGRFIDVEPDSLIVLQKAKGEIALDLMEGSLFVNAQSKNTEESSKQTFVLNSKQGKVDLNGATATLAKGSQDQLNLQVLEGEAKIKKSDGQSEEIRKGTSGTIGESGFQFNQNSIQIISPTPLQLFYSDPEALALINFEWKGFPPDWAIDIYSGESRKSLIILKELNQGTHQFKSEFKPGKYFWKLVGRDPKNPHLTGETSIQKLNVVTRLAPIPIIPTNNSITEVSPKSSADIIFKWKPSEKTKKIIFEISKETLFEKPLLKRTYDSIEGLTQPQLLSGTYYWRVSALYEDSEIPVLGRTLKFEIKENKPVEIPKDPMKLSWIVFPKNGKVDFLEKAQFEVGWESLNRTDEVAQWNLQYKIIQNNPSTQANPYKDLHPVTHTIPKENSKHLQQITILKPGTYEFKITALNANKEEIGESPTQLVKIEEPALLKPPQFLPKEGDLKADQTGSTDVHWESILGSKAYELSVKDNQGKELAKKVYSQTSTKLNNLMPGTYKLHIFTIDLYNRKSADPTVRTLIVPDKSDVRAPSGFKIKVKDDE